MAEEKTKLSLKKGTRAKTDRADPWQVLVVDDEPQVHSMTQVLLRDFQFEGRPFAIVSAHSAGEAQEILKANHDIPVVLLDVVMETDHAGLDLARMIREDLGDRRQRIILRTGQPGEAPERDVMLAYDINDYRAKTELTAQKLFTALVAALRSWQQISTIEQLNATLEARVEERTRDLAEARAFAESLVELMPQPVWFKDAQQRYRLTNRAFRELFAIAPDQWHGMTAAQALGARMPAHEEAGDQSLLGGHQARIELETQLVDARDQQRTLLITKGVFTQDETVLGIIGIATDISERKALEKELHRLAVTDPLTGAANRRRFMASGHIEIERAARYQTPLSVVMLDIDYFKKVNDTHGHGIGDEVLRKVADAVQGCLREIDLLGRLGGEEFAVLLPETGLDAAVAVAERLRRAIGAIIIPVTGGALTVTASFGVAERDADELLFDTFLGRADGALYRAKESGRDRVDACRP
ncbi:PAS:GGDEF [Magnetospirillum sp. LM-5]|uniref:diguanylate cyclase n=1 Tax=Magnetospirillum sp. LM-5 TaxID=2681466 RepID=UPI0013819CF8|nr:diguanylate cyclase [Magnetospirillum sp. LM-5]CAA7619352.1 PAS:GGDEF [Magnetospirillum sp. LM-5]